MSHTQKPKISVIIPVYNVEQYLPRCLDSIIGQTFSDLEIVCVNDGSPDNSDKILLEYAKKDPRIKIITQENGGLSAARNTGLKNISGEYVSFIDSDDWIDSDYYEQLLKLVEENDADIAMAGMRIANANGISNNTTPNVITDDFVEKIKNLPNGSVCDKLFRTKLFSGIEFPRGRYYEDNIVLITVMYKSKTVVFSNRVSYYYFVNQSGICRTTDSKVLEKRTLDKLYFTEQIMNFAREHGYGDSDEIKLFIVRTVANDFVHRKSPYYNKIKQILGANFVQRIIKSNQHRRKIKNFLLRILCLFIPSRKLRHKIKDYFNKK